LTRLEQDRHRVGVQQQIAHLTLMRGGRLWGRRVPAQFANKGQKLVGLIRAIAILIRAII
jgi:hypothetical protein